MQRSFIYKKNIHHEKQVISFAFSMMKITKFLRFISIWQGKLAITDISWQVLDR